MVVELYYQNVRGLNGKASLILPMVCLLCYDIIGFTETWTQCGFHSSEVFPVEHYTVYRKDRNLSSTEKTTGGGVLLAVKRSFKNVRRIYSFERDNLEMIWICIELSMPIYICCAYLPDRSSSNAYIEFIKSLQDNIGSISDKEYRILILGDFNLSSMYWQPQADGSFLPYDYMANDLHGTNAEIVHMMNCFELRQFNSLYNANDRLLDLALTDIDSKNIRCSEPSTLLCSTIDSHHPPFQLSVNFAKPQYLEAKEPPRYNFLEADYAVINGELRAVSWNDVLKGTVDDMVASFYLILNSIIDCHIPAKRWWDSRYPVWFSSALIRDLDSKNKLHREWKRTRCQDTYLKFRDLRNKVKSKVASCFQRFVSTFENNMVFHLKEF